jgi:hypothetical protein
MLRRQHPATSMAMPVFWCKAYIRRFAAMILTCSFLIAGVIPLQAQDSDSLKFYRKLKRAANKYRATRMMYEAVFRDPEPREYPKLPVAGEQKHVNPYLLFPGKIIRHINITVYDPFGYSVHDSMVKKINGIQRMGNYFHVTTRRWIIHNRLLFKENDSINPLALSETERMIREFSFVNDARVFISPTPSRDSVDVNVLVHDKWPVVVPSAATEQSAWVRFRNSNLFGTAQRFENYLGFRRPDVYEMNGSYGIANIDRTYIASSLGYNWNPDNTTLSLGFERPFYSPLAKWAGSLWVAHSWRKHQYFHPYFLEQRSIPLNLLMYDVWLGKTIKFSKSASLFNQSTNLLTGLRYYNSMYLNRPGPEIDASLPYRNHGNLLGNIGIAIQQYYKDKFIYRFGANEDVPEGLIIQFVYGGTRREYEKVRYYNGIEIARARHFSFGYLSATISSGIYYNTKVPNDVTSNFILYYFSDLLKAGRWHFRQFLNYKAVHGENKMWGETVTIRGDELYGFAPAGLAGSTKMIWSSETVAYMPYNLIGFRFAPVFTAGFGMVGDRQNTLAKSYVFKGYSLGLMLRNENLLNSTFQVSVGYYPFLPDGREHVVVYNPVTSFTFRVRAFSVSRPEFVSY